MKINPGDVVFSAQGRPGVVLDREKDTGKLVVEAKGENFEKARMNGFVNGLSVEDRKRFTDIIDVVKRLEDPKERVSAYGKQIEELKQDPRNRHLVRYLTAEMAHVMYSEGVSPRHFIMDENKVNN